MLLDIHLDFETRSHVEPADVGPVNYAFHPSTQATVITWCFGRTGMVKAWRIGMPFPQDLVDVFANPHKYNINAFNTQFDYLIYCIVFARQFPHIPFTRPKVENLSDTMAIAAHFRMGNSLDTVAKMLRLPFQKDTGNGKKLMMKQARYGELTEDEWEIFMRYAVLDTAVLRAAYYAMPDMPAQERWAWEWTFKRNLRGLNIDLKLVETLNLIKNHFTPRLLQEFASLTGGKSAKSPKQCLQFFQLYYPEITNMQAQTIDELMLDERPVPPFVRKALDIKYLTGSTSLSKIDVAMRHHRNSVIYAFLAFSHAQTKRWAGRGIQVQNFARFDKDVEDKIDFDLNRHDITAEILAKAETLKDPLGFVKNLLRRIWIPSPGKAFYCGDWAKIEPTALFWLLDLGPIPKYWYEETAAAVYNMTPEQVIALGKESFERQIGKMANLSCQYGSGWKSFQKAVKKDAGLSIDVDLSKTTVKAYRSKYYQVAQFWKDLENGFRKAIYEPARSEWVPAENNDEWTTPGYYRNVPEKFPETTVLCNGKIVISPMSAPVKGVQIRLANGANLYYPGARIHENKQVYDEDNDRWFWTRAITYLTDENKRIIEKNIYGGMICENVVSCTAQQIIAPAIFRLEEAGFEVLNLVHDEMWAQAEEGRLEEFQRLFEVRPYWCRDMHIGSEVNSAIRYLK